jgi:hypothetical protein
MLFSRDHAENTWGSITVATVLRCFQWLTILPITVLLGCVPLQSKTQPRSTVPANSTVLFSITLNSASVLDREPTGLIVNVEVQHGSASKQFAFTPNSRIPGHHTTFLVRLDLPPGRCSLSRFSGIAADGMPIPQFDVAPNIAFDVRKKETVYIGHIELSNPSTATGSTPGVSRLVVADAFEDELPSFVHAWPALRGHAISRHALAGVTPIPVQTLGQAGQQQPAHAASQATEGQGTDGKTAARLDASSAAVAMARLDSSAAAALPPDAQRAFRHFLASSYPRAFAVTVTGSYTGVAAGGADVIGRALRNCKQVQPAERKTSCRLFALDDTLLSSLRGAVAKRPSSNADR